MANDRPITLQDIADLAKVSRSTVSLVLRNSPRISSDVTARVLAAAESVGYKPNPLLGALMTQLRARKTRQYQGGLAFISHYPLAKMQEWRSQEYEIFHHAKAHAEKIGYSLDFLLHDETHWPDAKLNSILRSRNMQGVIVGPLDVPVSTLRIEWARYASVCWSYSLTDPPLHRVTHDYYGSMLRILEELQGLGYERIGFCTHQYEDLRTNHFSIAAYLYYQHNLPAARRIDYLGTPAPVWDEALLMKWYRRHHPDVIVCTNPKALAVLQQNGIKVPDDVGFVVSSIEDDSAELSGIHYDNRAIGTNLVDTVVSQLNSNERGVPVAPKGVHVPGILRWSTSVRRRGE